MNSFMSLNSGDMDFLFATEEEFPKMYFHVFLSHTVTAASSQIPSVA